MTSPNNASVLSLIFIASSKSADDFWYLKPFLCICTTYQELVFDLLDMNEMYLCPDKVII